MDINFKLYEELNPNEEEYTLAKLGERFAAIAEKIKKLRNTYGDEPIEFWVEIDWEQELDNYPKEKEIIKNWSANDFILHIGLDG